MPTIACWTDDPLNNSLLEVAVPALGTGPMAVKLTGTAPAPNVYPSNDARFRWWNATEALRRARSFWAPLLPAQTRWMTGSVLKVALDDGDDLNAYYDRTMLRFYHAAVAGQTIYSGESPDIVAHEFGHAVLDALQPALFDAMSIEAAAFHEAFGDISAMLSSLQVPDIRAALLDETGGHIHRTSRISRIGEQLGWALRQRNPGFAEADCLRNAANAFFYRDPNLLPPSGPATTLTSQPHSFGRVFSGAFLELLDGIFQSQGAAGSPDDRLVATARDAGQLLVDAVRIAPVVPDYFTQVAAAMVRADAQRNGGRYGHVVRSAFARRGILSVQSATGLSSAPVAVALMGAAPAAQPRPARGGRGGRQALLPLQAFPGAAFGFAEPALVVRSPSQPREFAASPSALDAGSLEPPNSQLAARAFFEDLYRLGRIDIAGHEGAGALLHPYTRKTHELRPEGTNLFVARRLFDCGLDPIC